LRPSPAIRLARAAGVALILAWSLGPVALGLMTSLQPRADVAAGILVPHRFSLDGYRAVLGIGDAGGRIVSEAGAFSHALANSAIVTVESVLVLLAISLTAGYAFARLRFRGQRLVFGALLVTLVVPVFALVSPLFRIMADLGLIDSQAGLVLIYTSTNVPLSTWLVYNACRELPIEPEEAALLDGCSRLGLLWRIVLPQLRSAIAALTAILMLSVWGAFLVPLLFAPTLATKPATVLITEFVGKYTTNYPLLAAAGMLILLPPAVVAVALNRHIRGMLGGG